MKKSHLIIAILVTATLAVASIPAGGGKDDSLTQQLPGADDLLHVTDPDSASRIMLAYEGFTVAFNPATHQPAYVMWELTEARANADDVSRSRSKFAADPAVEGCATLDDYRNSGFDRGHLAPAADMKWSARAMDDCHMLTNICPQEKSVNAGAWATVEKNSRKWANRYGTLYIVAGPVEGDRMTRHIGLSRLPVPERFFKVIVAPEADPPMGIAFLMPNHPFDGGAQAAVTSIDEIETITGYDFFAALPDDIEDEVEAQHSMARWNH